jgi:hypothetical protein
MGEELVASMSEGDRFFKARLKKVIGSSPWEGPLSDGEELLRRLLC